MARGRIARGGGGVFDGAESCGGAVGAQIRARAGGTAGKPNHLLGVAAAKSIPQQGCLPAGVLYESPQDVPHELGVFEREIAQLFEVEGNSGIGRLHDLIVACGGREGNATNPRNQGSGAP